MTKHIFGLIVFGVIFSLTAIGFAYFYSPQIPQIAEITAPSKITAIPASCFPQFNTPISSKIETIEFDLDTGKIISKIKTRWNGQGKAPEKIIAGVHLFTVEAGKEGFFNDKQTIISPFASGNETEITLDIQVKQNLDIDSSKNLYALIEFSEDGKFEDYIEGSEDLTKAHQVLFIHGRSSIIRK